MPPGSTCDVVARSPDCVSHSWLMSAVLCRCPPRIFSHPNVLPMLGACQSPPAPHPIIITHWMPYGSLYNVLHEGTSEYLCRHTGARHPNDLSLTSPCRRRRVAARLCGGPDASGQVRFGHRLRNGLLAHVGAHDPSTLSEQQEHHGEKSSFFEAFTDVAWNYRVPPCYNVVPRSCHPLYCVFEAITLKSVLTTY